MNVFDGLRLATRSILGNKLRSFLTALGVIIGVAAVIALVAVGQGANAQIRARVEGLGTNLIQVIPIRSQGTTLTLQNTADIPSRVHEISAMMPAINGGVTAAWGEQTWQTRAQGVTQIYPKLRSAKVGVGRFFTARDVSDMANVCVLGETVVQQLQMTGNPVGQTVMLNGLPFTVDGVMAPVGGGTGGQNQDDMVLIPVTTAQLLLGTRTLSVLYLQARSAALAPLAVGHVQAIFNHEVGRSPAVFVVSQDQLLQTLNATTQTQTLLLGAIAGVALLVGGIGIMNIMLVSVAERTREIGIRKAVGAKRRHILLQFLLEAGAISVLGGLMGVGVGIGSARLVSRLAGWTAIVSSTSVAVAFAFALLIGLGFGVWPAMKAAILDPIQALRYE